MKPLSSLYLCSLLMAMTSLPATAADLDRATGRSMVLSTSGIAATEHPLASQAAAQVLAKGGNAIDAAVAANAVMTVVSPMMCGLGGDLFAIVYDAKTGETHGLNASGWSPARLTREHLLDQGHDSIPTFGIESVTVPGTVAGWDALISRFGKKTMKEVLAPAVYYAEHGFPVTEFVAGYWQGSEQQLRQDANAAATFLPNDRAPKVGDIFRNPDMAWSLKQISNKGRDAFYDGPIGKRIVDYSKKLGGVMSLDDLREFEAEWVDPIQATYRGWTVYEIPPNGQGIAALMMLNIMEQFPIHEQPWGSADSLHTMIESKKLAYADMLQFVADMRKKEVPVEGLLDKDYARQRAARIDANHANCDVPHGSPFDPGPDTTYLSTVDAEGNMVSLIQSIYYGFGSGLVADGTGFALQNRGALFSMDPEHPNLVSGRTRPLHTIIPGMMARDQVRVAFGIMGGWNQSQAHAQFVSNLIDHNLNIQEALEAPRFTKISFEGCDLIMENRFDPEVIKALEQRGHQIELRGPFTQITGGGQAVLRNYATGINYGASDPRKDGAAIPEPLRP